MPYSLHAIRTAAFIAALGLAAPALAQGASGSASAVDIDPFTGEVVSTTSSVLNQDGSRTVTVSDAEGNVIGESTVITDPHTGDRVTTETNPDGSTTVTATNPQGEEVSSVTVPAAPATTDESESPDSADFEEWGDDDWDDDWDPDSTETEAPAETANSRYSDDADHHAGDDPERQPSDVEELLDELLEIEDELNELRDEHRDLLDEAATIEDYDERQKVLKKAREVLDKREALNELFFDKRLEATRLGGSFGPIEDPGLSPFEPDEEIDDDAHPLETADSKAGKGAAAASSNAVRNAVSVAVNSGIRTALNGVTNQAVHSATRSAIVAVRPRVETPRIVITARPTMYRH